MVDMSFLQERRDVILAIALAVVVTIFLLFMVWPWKGALLLTLWAGYVLWWPTVWLEKYIHRRGLAALIVVVVTAVVLFLALIALTGILVVEVAQLAQQAANTNTSLSGGLSETVKVINPDLARSGPVLTVIAAAASGGGVVASTVTGTVGGVVRTIFGSLPLILLQLVLVFVLLVGILARGDIIVNDFKSAVPSNYRPIVNRFLNHLNPIYYSFFVIYVAVAILVGIIAAIVWGLLGVPFFLTFAVLIVFVGLIPSIGRALVYIPLALYLLANGNTVTGLIVLIFSIVVFELIIRYTIQPRWMERTARVPRALTLIAFTFALAAFGVIGFAIGPALVGFALAMWRTYRDIQREREEQAPTLEQPSGEQSGVS